MIFSTSWMVHSHLLRRELGRIFCPDTMQIILWIQWRYFLILYFTAILSQNHPYLNKNVLWPKLIDYLLRISTSSSRPVVSSFANDFSHNSIAMFRKKIFLFLTNPGNSNCSIFFVTIITFLWMYGSGGMSWLCHP